MTEEIISSEEYEKAAAHFHTTPAELKAQLEAAAKRTGVQLHERAFVFLEHMTVELSTVPTDELHKFVFGAPLTLERVGKFQRPIFGTRLVNFLRNWDSFAAREIPPKSSRVSGIVYEKSVLELDNRDFGRIKTTNKGVGARSMQEVVTFMAILEATKNFELAPRKAEHIGKSVYTDNAEVLDETGNAYRHLGRTPEEFLERLYATSRLYGMRNYLSGPRAKERTIADDIVVKLLGLEPATLDGVFNRYNIFDLANINLFGSRLTEQLKKLKNRVSKSPALWMRKSLKEFTRDDFKAILQDRNTGIGPVSLIECLTVIQFFKIKDELAASPANTKFTTGDADAFKEASRLMMGVAERINEPEFRGDLDRLFGKHPLKLQK